MILTSTAQYFHLRRPRGSWAGQQQPRDTPSPAFSLSLAGSCAAARDPIYDGVGPRTSADGSSVINLNKSMDNAAPGPQQVTIIKLILPHNTIIILILSSQS